MSKQNPVTFEEKALIGLALLASSPALATGSGVGVFLSGVTAFILLPVKYICYRRLIHKAAKDLFGFSDGGLKGSSPWVRILIGVFGFAFAFGIGCKLGFHESTCYEFVGKKYCHVSQLTFFSQYVIGSFVSWFLELEILCLANQKRPKSEQYLLFLILATGFSLLINIIPLAFLTAEQINCVLN